MAVYDKDFELEAQAGVDSFFTLPFPHRGKIVRLICKQVAGELDGFSLDLYCSKEVLPEVASASISVGLNPAIDADIFRVIPTQTVGVGGTMVELIGQEFDYTNRDGTPSIAENFLYLRLHPLGAENKVFQISIAQTTPIF